MEGRDTKHDNHKTFNKMLKLVGMKSSTKSSKSGKAGDESFELIFQSSTKDGNTHDTTSRTPSKCMYTDAQISPSDAELQTKERQIASIGKETHQNKKLLDRSGNATTNTTQSAKILLDGKKGDLRIGQEDDDDDDDDDTDM